MAGDDNAHIRGHLEQGVDERVIRQAIAVKGRVNLQALEAQLLDAVPQLLDCELLVPWVDDAERDNAVGMVLHGLCHDIVVGTNVAAQPIALGEGEHDGFVDACLVKLGDELLDRLRETVLETDVGVRIDDEGHG